MHKFGSLPPRTTRSRPLHASLLPSLNDESHCELDSLADARCTCAALVMITAAFTTDPQRQAKLVQAVRTLQAWQLRLDLRLITNR